MSESTSSIPALSSLTLAQIASGLDSGAFTVAQLVQAHLDRIAHLDTGLYAVLQVNPNAINIAKGLDAELKQSGRRGLLHGAPILIKDNVVTHEPLEATAGSLALVGAKPARESPAVSKLRDAGCVILGTTNCSEWANFRSRPSDSGWSARGGQTYGAYHDKQDPSGSSSGSGVAVDMGFCVLALGTETSGSIISPSTQNNIVGLKPTTGLVSRDAVIPISPVQDTPGPMARTVVDAAAMLTVIAGRDDHDSKTAEIPFATVPDYHAATKAPLPTSGQLRLGIPLNTMQSVKKPILAAFESRVVAPLREKGVTIVDCAFPGLARFKELSLEEKTNYMAGEFHDALPKYLASLTTNPQNIDSLEALCDYTRRTPGEEYGEQEDDQDEEEDEELEDGGDTGVDANKAVKTPKKSTPASGPPRRNIYRLEQTQRITRDSPEFAAARENATYFAGSGGIQGALDGGEGPDGHGTVDALLLPTAAGAANYFAACEGHPQITIPLGYQDADAKVKYNDTGRLVDTGPNVPFGVSIIGRKYSEAELLPICRAIEELTHARDEADSRRLAHLRG